MSVTVNAQEVAALLGKADGRTPGAQRKVAARFLAANYIRPVPGAGYVYSKARVLAAINGGEPAKSFQPMKGNQHVR